MTDYQTVHWDATGKPYWIVDDSPHYIPPATAAQMDDPKLKSWAAAQPAANGSFLHNAGTWNVGTGNMDQGLNKGNLLSLGILGAIAAPAALGALGGGGGAAATLGPSTAANIAATSTGAGLAAPAALSAGAATAGGSILGMNPLTAAIYGGSELARLFGAHQAASASTEAAKIQAASAQKALDLQAQLFGQQKQDFAPYLQMGQGAANQLGASLTGLQRPNVPGSVAGIVGPTNRPIGQPAPTAGPMVMLQSPDGQHTQSFSANDPSLQHYLSLGAKRIA